MRNRIILPLIAIALAATAPTAMAQQPGPPDAQKAATARDMAPFDPTGYWVSIVTEDWRVRMATPQIGDHVGIPMNKTATQAADNWNPQADIDSGQECKAFGIGRIMREPTRLHITWEGDNTLDIDTDAGKQHRALRFGPDQKAPMGDASRQGYSKADWIMATSGSGLGFGAPTKEKYGTLHVVTSDVLPGYLRKNGVPYSDQTVVTEYIDYLTNPDGTEFLVVKTHVWDPVNLTEPYITSSNFRRQKNKDGWNPQPCHMEIPPAGKPAGFG